MWLTLAVICLLFAIYRSFLAGFNEGYMFFILSAVALIMFFLRKKVRVASEKKKN